MSTPHSLKHVDELKHHLEIWVEHELITREQASRILAEELGADDPGGSRSTPAQLVGSGRAPASPNELPTASSVQRGSLVTEGLGYVGGILILIATGIIAGQYFADLGRTGRLAVTGVAAVALLGSGHLVRAAPARPAAGRLRSVLWVLAVAAVAFFLGLLADETFGWTGEEVTFLAASGAAVVGLSLWRRHRWLLQQVAVVAALAVANGSGVAAYLGDGDVALSGLAIWGVGGVWLMLGWGRHVRPRYATDLLGGIVVTIGAQVTMHHDWGAALAVATAAGLLVTGVRLRALVLLGVGSVATLTVVPGVMQRYFPDTLGAPLALLATGILLVVAALATASRVSRGQPAKAEPAPLRGMGGRAIIGFAVIVAGAVATLSRA